MEDDKLAVYPVLKRTGGVRLSVYCSNDCCICDVGIEERATEPRQICLG